MEKLKGHCHCEAVKWSFEGPLTSVTACNCTICRRYGALWAYGYVGEEIQVSATTTHYMREPKGIEFHFCGSCGCLASWRSSQVDDAGKRRIAVNVRLVDDPTKVQHLLIDHFDGLVNFEDLPSDGKCVKDLWF